MEHCSWQLSLVLTASSPMRRCMGVLTRVIGRTSMVPLCSSCSWPAFKGAAPEEAIAKFCLSARVVVAWCCCSCRVLSTDTTPLPTPPCVLYACSYCWWQDCMDEQEAARHLKAIRASSTVLPYVTKVSATRFSSCAVDCHLAVSNLRCTY